MIALPNVVLLIETSTSWGTGLLKGISRFVRERNWSVHVEPSGQHESLHLPPGWEGDGVIARIPHRGLHRELLEYGSPVVSVSWFDYDGPNIGRCTADERACGRLAAEHLVECGFRHFGYCGPVDRPEYVDQLGRSFQEALQSRGRTCHTFTEPDEPLNGRRDWMTGRFRLAAWLRSLPKPIGLFAWSTVRARELAEACRLAELEVPQDAAILGGLPDDLIGTISNPPLSYVDVGAERIGYEAARLLGRMMSGAAPPPEPVLVPPVGIVQRRSTDIAAVEDPVLAEAIRFMRAHASEPIRVQDIPRHVPISRRVLEQQCKRLLGRSPAAELRRLRIERAKQMLMERPDTISQIATRCGFNHTEVLIRTFKAHVGMTPTQYRRRHGVLPDPSGT